MHDELERLTRDLQDAVQMQVRERLEALAAPGFRLLTSRSGNPSTREECISIAIGSFCVTSNEVGRFDVVSARETAVVTHHLTQHARMDDRVGTPSLVH